MNSPTPANSIEVGNRVFMAVREAIDLPRDKRLLASKAVMDAVWAQPRPANNGHCPKINSIADLVDALQGGFSYNINEGNQLYSWFGDIRPVGTNGRLLGHGIQAPDGAVVRDGRELVAWRDRRWAELNSPGSPTDITNEQ